MAPGFLSVGLQETQFFRPYATNARDTYLLVEKKSDVKLGLKQSQAVKSYIITN